MRRRYRNLLLLLLTLLFTHHPEKKKARHTPNDRDLMPIDLWQDRYRPIRFIDSTP